MLACAALRLPGEHARPPRTHRRLAIGALLAWSLSGAGTLAYGAAAAEIEEVIVTGTWIAGTPEDAPLPVTRISAEELRDAGSPDAVEMLRNLSFSQGADGESDQYGSRTGADRASVNLRGLGPSRTLVLLNGRRLSLSPGSIPDQAQLFVDANLLPWSALERIEVLRDGAAATYGSDAIGGVVNFITRADFEGVELAARHRTIADSDGDSRVGLTAGAALGGGGHLTTSLGVADRSPLPLAARDWAVRPRAENVRGGWSGTGHPTVFVPLQAFAETAGNVAAMRAVGIVDPNCERVGGARTNVPATVPQGGVCRYQYTPFVNLVQDTRRWQWLTYAEWNFAGGTRLSGELLAAETHVPNWTTSPSYPPSEVVDPTRLIQANNPALVDMASKYPDLYGDFAWCEADYCRWTGDGDAQDAAGVAPAWQNVAWTNGRLYGQEGPLRGHPRRSTARRGALQLDGDTGAGSWLVALTSSWTRRVEEDADMLNYRGIRAHLGLGGFDCEHGVANEYDAEGRIAFGWQTLRDHAGQGPCRYWMPFSNAVDPHPYVPGASNPDYEPHLGEEHLSLVDYLTTRRGFVGHTSLTVVDVLLNGDAPWLLAGGPLQYAFGAQWRREAYERREYSAERGPRGGALQDLSLYPCRGGPAIADCATGRTGVFSYLPPGYDVNTSRPIYSVFGEVALPFVPAVDGQLSLRYEDYRDNGGSSLDYKAALSWRPLAGLTLRASMATTFRAPTLNQTEPGIASTSRQFVGRIGTFKPIRALGNPALAPEQAATSNVGAVFETDELVFADDHLTLSVDLWRYAFEKPLVLEPYLRVLDLACPPTRSECDSGSPYHGRVHLGGQNTVWGISAIDVDVINGPDVDTDGVDFKAEYVLATGRGEWAAGAGGTRTLSWQIASWQFGSAYDAIGRLNYDTPLARSVLKWKGNVWLRWSLGPATAQWSLRYTGAYAHDSDSEPMIEAHATHDLTASYDLLEGRLTVDAAVLNAADADPPRVLRQINYDPLTHNPLGRMLQLGIRWRR